MRSIFLQILCLFRLLTTVKIQSVAGYMTFAYGTKVENKCKRCEKESAYIIKVHLLRVYLAIELART